MRFGNAAMGRVMHSVASHWLLIFMAIHLGLHGANINPLILKMKVQENKVVNIFINIIVIFIALYGIFAFVKREIFSKLLHLTMYPLFINVDNMLLVYVDYIAIILLIAFVTHKIIKFHMK